MKPFRANLSKKDAWGNVESESEVIVIDRYGYLNWVYYRPEDLPNATLYRTDEYKDTITFKAFYGERTDAETAKYLKSLWSRM